MLHEKITLAFQHANQHNIPQEQIAQTLRQDSLCDIKIPQKELVKIIRRHDPNFRITEADQEQLAARKAQGREFREKLLTKCMDRERIYTELGIPNRFRHIQHFLDYSNSPQAEENNRKWRDLLTAEPLDEAALANAIFDHIKNVVLPAVQPALNASPEETLENFTQFKDNSVVIMELDKIIPQHPFTEEQKKELQVLRHLQHPLNERLYRVDLLASPLYGEIPLEKVDPDVLGSKELYDDLAAASLKYGEAAHKPEEMLPNGPTSLSAQTLRAYFSFQLSYGLAGQMEYIMASNNIDPRMVYTLEGTRLPSSEAIGSDLMHTQPLFASIPGKGVVPVVANLSSDPPKVETGSPAAYEAMTRAVAGKPGELLRQCKAADPWWMRGSSEYAAMERSMERFAKLTQGLIYPLENAAGLAPDLMAAAMELRAASKSYLEYKQGQNGISTDENGLLQGKTSRETSRLRAAAAAEALGKQMEFLLTCQLDPMAAHQNCEDALRSDDREAAILAEKARKEREEADRQRTLRMRQEEEKNRLPENQLCSYSFDQLKTKMTEHKAVVPEAKFEGDKLPQWHETAGAFLGMLARSAQSKIPLTPTQQSAGYQMMSAVICFHLVQQERVWNARENPDAPFTQGTIEKHLLTLGNPPNLSSDPAFRKFVGEPLTPARIGSFLMNDEGKTMGLKYLQSLSKDNQKVNDPMTAVIRQNKTRIDAEISANTNGSSPSPAGFQKG